MIPPYAEKDTGRPKFEREFSAFSVGYDEETEEDFVASQNAAKRCLRFTNLLLLLTGVGLGAYAIYALEDAYGTTAQALVYAIVIVGGTVLAVGFLGCLGSLRGTVSILLIYYTFLLFSTLALFVLGGLCFLLLDSVINYIDNNWDTILREQSAQDRSTMSQGQLEDDVKQHFYIMGSACLVMFCLLLSAMSNVVRLVTPVRAYSLLLQATNISLLPMGIALIAAALYMADTAASADAPYAAFAVFILGVTVIMITLVGCVGTSLHSRGIVRLFMYLVSALSFLFLAFGIMALVQADVVQNYVSDHWESIRQVLPPTFSGRYDKEQFERFVKANLRALGFMSLVSGLVLSSQSWASSQLRYALKVETQQESEMVMAGLTPSSTDKPGMFRLFWKQKWTNGTKASRRVIKCACCGMGFCVLIILAVSCLVLYFSTSCSQLGDYEHKYHKQLAMNQSSVVHLHQVFGRGLTELAVSQTASSVGFAVSVGAIKESFASDTEPTVSYDPKYQSYGVTLKPKAPTRVFGFDISCQHADTQIELPSATTYGGNERIDSTVTPSLYISSDSDRAATSLDLTNVMTSLKPRLRFLNVTSTSGPIDVLSAFVGVDGMYLSSELGEISVSDTNIQCDPAQLGGDTGNTRISSEKGSVMINKLTSSDCDMYIQADASFVQLQESSVSASNGGAMVYASSMKGRVLVETSRADNFYLVTDEGSVRGTNISVLETLKVSSVAGGIDLANIQMDTRAVFQAETENGIIFVHFHRFAGIISIVTGGNVQCSGDGFDSPSDQNPCPTSTVSESGNSVKVVDQVSANCEASNDCPYSGELTITSQLGDVHVIIDKWSR